MEEIKTNKLIAKHLRDLLVRVPATTSLEGDDLGYLIVMAICHYNGATLIDNQIFHGDVVIGNQLNFRFDGYVLQLAYISTLHNKLISTSLRIA